MADAVRVNWELLKSFEKRPLISKISAVCRLSSKPQSKTMITDGHKANKQHLQAFRKLVYCCVFLVNNPVYQSIGIRQVSAIFLVLVLDQLVKSGIGASLIIL